MCVRACGFACVCVCVRVLAVSGHGLVPGAAGLTFTAAIADLALADKKREAAAKAKILQELRETHQIPASVTDADLLDAVAVALAGTCELRCACLRLERLWPHSVSTERGVHSSSAASGRLRGPGCRFSHSRSDVATRVRVRVVTNTA